MAKQYDVYTVHGQSWVVHGRGKTKPPKGKRDKKQERSTRAVKHKTAAYKRPSTYTREPGVCTKVGMNYSFYYRSNTNNTDNVPYSTRYQVSCGQFTACTFVWYVVVRPCFLFCSFVPGTFAFHLLTSTNLRWSLSHSLRPQSLYLSRICLLYTSPSPRD